MVYQSSGETNERAGTRFLPNSAKEQGILGGVVEKFEILFSLSFVLKSKQD